MDNVIDRNWNWMDFEFKCKNPGEYLIVFRWNMKIKESGKIPLSHFSGFWDSRIFQDTSVNYWRMCFGISQDFRLFHAVDENSRNFEEMIIPLEKTG